ncbi:MAG TPA: response regulator transcription factor [Actinomycetota bacterium]|nr:response regulator transcription factor [Actinomycetota bacterium]
MPVTVVVADDHSMVRQGLRRTLEETPDIEVVGEASTGAQAVDVVARTSPDMVLLDVRMPDMDGIEATGEITSRFPGVNVVMLTGSDDRRLVLAAVRAGARGYILKTREAETLAGTLRLVAEGNLVIDPEVAAAVGEELAGGAPAHGLTDREMEILKLVADGLTNREIGARLYVSADTVKTHLEHVFQKLGASDRTAAVAQALRRGLIE